MSTLLLRLVAAAVLAAACGGALAQTRQPEAAEPAADEPYWRRAREGWFWQQDPPPQPKEKPPAARPADPKPELTDQDRDLADFNAFKANLERALNAATQNPSDANVARLLELMAEASNKASALSDAAGVVSARMPWLNATMSGTRPTLPAAQRAYDSIEMQDRDQLLREMAGSYGLYFFFRRNCAYCHIQSPLLQQFAQKYGFTVFAVSMDGGTLPEFPGAVLNNGLAEQVADAMGIPQQHFVVPAVVLARPSTREVVPVGFGAMNMDQMADRVAMIVRVRENGAGRASRTTMAALFGAEAPAPTPAAPSGRR